MYYKEIEFILTHPSGIQIGNIINGIKVSFPRDKSVLKNAMFII